MRTPDLLDYVVGASLRGGGTARDLALRLGVTRSRATTLLWGLPSTKVRYLPPGRDRRFAIWLPKEHVSGTTAKSAWRRFTTAANRHREQRGPAETRHEQVLLRAEDARQALADGDWERVNSLLKEPVLTPSTIRRHITKKWTDPILGNLWTLRAGAAMESGRADEAVRAARFALRRRTDVEMRLRAWGILGAALRMLGTKSLEESVDAYDHGIQEALKNRRDLPPWVLRNLHASAVAPLLAMGRLNDARLYIAKAQAYRHADDPSGVENDVRVAQLSVAAGGTRTDFALGKLAEVADDPNAPFYIKGWRTRCEAAAIAATGADVARFNSALVQSWEGNSGYGFQQRLVLARLAASPRLFCPDLWSRASLVRLTNAIARYHRQRLGTRPSECTTCSGRSLPERAAHALGFAPGSLPVLYST